MRLSATRFLSLVVLTGTSSLAWADLSAVPSGAYVEDPTHAYIDFSYNHLGLSNPSLSFDDFNIALNLDNEDPTQSTINITIDADSIVAGSEIWKDHLSGGDFFDIENYPEITFTSTSVEATGEMSYTVNGELQIKGQSKPATFEVTINGAMDHPMSGKPVIGFAATGQLLRSDYGIDKYAPAIGNEVMVEVSAELVAAE